ncbi:hypothetical protein HY496_01200 [Candidatus Woesearchaeota archaeon]|nr:hypothetical protein [Candidatus Woesearchaeota archaeon]
MNFQKIRPEVKGVLAFAVLLLLVLAGFYISYISLKDNLPEGETFTSFVGNAFRQIVGVRPEEKAENTSNTDDLDCPSGKVLTEGECV